MRGSDVGICAETTSGERFRRSPCHGDGLHWRGHVTVITTSRPVSNVHANIHLEMTDVSLSIIQFCALFSASRKTKIVYWHITITYNPI